MALHLGTGRIETRGPAKLPKLQKEVDRVLVDLGWERTYEGKEPPAETPEDEATQFELLENDDGVLAVTIAEERVVRDLARLLSERLAVELEVFTTAGSLFGRRGVDVSCRRFAVRHGELEEIPVMATHTVEVTDVEHNELRQVQNALLARIRGANEALLEAEASRGLKRKKVLRYRWCPEPIKWSSPRLGRLMDQIEACETFAFEQQGVQRVVKVMLPGGAKSMAYLKEREFEELEGVLAKRPELQHRRSAADASV